jgi:hypothetical protein
MPVNLEQVFEVLRAYCAEMGVTPTEVRVKFANNGRLTIPIPFIERQPLPVIEAPEPEPETPAQQAAFGHSPDFRSLRWRRREYPFTERQAPVVKLLWDAWEDGAPDVGTATLLTAAGTTGDRLRDVFQDNEAWGTIIVPGTSRGTYRLTE